MPQNLNNNTPQVLCNEQDSDSLAGYIDVNWDVTDKFSVAAGFRETRDETFLGGPHAGGLRRARRQHA